MLLQRVSRNGPGNVCWNKYFIGVLPDVTGLFLFLCYRSDVTFTLHLRSFFLLSYNVSTLKKNLTSSFPTQREKMSGFNNRNKMSKNKNIEQKKKKLKYWHKCQQWFFRQVRRDKLCFCVSPVLLEVPCSWWTMSIRPLFVPHSNLSKRKMPFHCVSVIK